MRIDEAGVEAYLLNAIWKNSLFSGILAQSDEVNLLRHVDIEPRLPKDREDLYHRAVDMVRARACDWLGEHFYTMLRERHGPPRAAHVEPIPEAHSVLINARTYIALKDSEPWGERRVLCSRFMEPGLLWYAGDLGKFGHDVMIGKGSKPLSWSVNYLWDIEWADPLPLQCIQVPVD